MRGDVDVMLMDCSYEHHSIDEPAILLGGGFMVDVVENAEEDVKKN
jgi:hypothetical protein